MALTHDLIIVGGGPAGCSAAITAARAGVRVLLLERGTFPRHKVCGEFVSPESIGLLTSFLGEDSPVLRNAPRIGRTRIYIDGRTIEIQLRPSAASITRYDLDSALWQAALAAGVDARTHAVEDVTTSKVFAAKADAGVFTASAVIVAAGRWSRLERFRPAVPEGPRWIGLKAHFEEPGPPATTDLYFFEHGYCGVQRVGDGLVNACAMVRSDVATTLDQVFTRHSALYERSRDWRQAIETVATSPLVFREPTPVRHRAILAGDAAGFIDPFAGDGIALALRTGALAAQALTAFYQGHCTLDEALRRYESVYRKHVLPTFRSAARLRMGLKLPPGLRTQAAKLLRIPAVAEFVVRSTRGRIPA